MKNLRKISINSFIFIFIISCTLLGNAQERAGIVRRNSIGMELVYIPPGDFMMGSSEVEIDEAFQVAKKQAGFTYPQPSRRDFINETPKHKVTIKEGFWMGRFEVTQAQWQTVMGISYRQQFEIGLGDSEYFEGPNYPIHHISWNDAKEFIRRLNERNDGFTYSLPSEAEWEYAARAGTTTRFAFGNSLSWRQANFNGSEAYAPTMKELGDLERDYRDNVDQKEMDRYGQGRSSVLKEVGQYKPNDWGLYDMHGNVFEWCEDIWNPSYKNLLIDGSANLNIGDSKQRVMRGGAYNMGADALRSASRLPSLPSNRVFSVGFRVVARLTPKKLNYVLFSSQKDGNQEIYQLDLTTGRATNLSQSGEDDGYPRCSPDGKKVAFATNRDGYWEIYLMNADGSRQQNLTKNRGGSGYMDWSPDGNTLVFASTRDGQKNNEIYTIRADGTDLKRLTNHPAEDVHPAWSPDGKRIAFASERDGNRQLYIMNADGTNLTRLTNNRWYDDYPAWSPDGSMIAFSSDRDSKSSDRLDIYVIDVAKSEVVRATSHPADDRHPAFASDNKTIAFASNRNGNRDIYTVRPDGKEELVFSSEGNDEHPHWCGSVEPKSITSDLFLIKDGGRYGYIDSTGKVVIKPQFFEGFPFEDGVALVFDERLKSFGYIDTTGKIIAQLQYDAAIRYYGKLTLVVKMGNDNKRRIGFIDLTGKVVIPLQSFDDVKPFREGFAAVKIGEKWGYIDMSGNMVIKPQFLDAYGFSHGLAGVKVNDNQIGFIDRTGKFVIHPQSGFEFPLFSEGLTPITVGGGKRVITVTPTEVIDPNPPITGFMDTTGKIVIKPQFDYAEYFKESLAVARKRGKYGFIDKSGNFVIPPQFDYAMSFSEGLALVSIGGKYGYINKKGEIVIKPQFDSGTNFINGVAVFDNMAINREGKIIWKVLNPSPK